MLDLIRQKETIRTYPPAMVSIKVSSCLKRSMAWCGGKGEIFEDGGRVGVVLIVRIRMYSYVLVCDVV